MSTGIELIAAERQRQIEAEGWTAEHDDTHKYSEMARAAICYVTKATRQVRFKNNLDPAALLFSWPWDKKWWKPNDDPIRNLEKAGALIAAEIDRLNRLASPAERQGSREPISLSQMECCG